MDITNEHLRVLLQITIAFGPALVVLIGAYMLMQWQAGKEERERARKRAALIRASLQRIESKLDNITSEEDEEEKPEQRWLN
jgi:hypothetical protein